MTGAYLSNGQVSHRFSYVVTKVYYGVKNSFGSGVKRLVRPAEIHICWSRVSVSIQRWAVFFLEDWLHACCFHSGRLARSPLHHTGQEQLLGEGVYFDLCLIFLLLRFSLLETRNWLETGHKIPKWTQTPRLVFLPLKQYTMYQGAPPFEQCLTQ